LLTVALVSTGHEVLRGHTLNTNAAWLARRVTEVGARVRVVLTVGDDLADLSRALSAAAAQAEAVLVTGGLGPTEDDRSREALAAVMGVALEHDERAWRTIRARFEAAGLAPSASQRRQALVPAGAVVLPNLQGTAPGLVARAAGAEVFLLPGPPREMQAMFEGQVLPRWRTGGRLDDVASRVVWTAGVPESEVAAPLEAAMRAEEPVVGTHPDEGEVAIRVLARGPGAASRADEVVRLAREALGPAVVSERDDERVQHALVARAKDRRLVLTTAESVTGGLVARMLCEVPGASDVFRGGWVVYSDAWKASALGVPEDLLRAHGPVSEAVARDMAERALARAPADVALATTGVAGPGPDAAGIAAGTAFVACALRDGPTTVRRLSMALPRLTVQRRVAVAVLDLARRLLAPR
jgi:nicotinamide-nucleotide amidase